MSKRFALAMALLLASVVVAADDKVEPKSSAAVKKLKIARRDVLKEALEARTAEFEAGRGTFATLAEVSRELLGAELALATKAEERVAAHKRRLDVAKTLEDRMKAGYDAGRCPLADYLLAKAARLEAEIGWLEAGGVEKKEKK